MKKYNFTKAYNDNDLREIINTLEKNNFQLYLYSFTSILLSI